MRKLLGNSTCSNDNLKVIFSDFPGGGADTFELVSRFCYNNGELHVMSSNVVMLHCAAKFMEVFLNRKVYGRDSVLGLVRGSSWFETVSRT